MEALQELQTMAVAADQVPEGDSEVDLGGPHGLVACATEGLGSC